MAANSYQDTYPGYDEDVRRRVQQRIAPPTGPSMAPVSGGPVTTSPLPTSPTAPSTAPPAPPGAPFDINAWGQGWTQSGGRTNQDFAAYVNAHPLGAGYSLSGNNGDRISGPNGYTRDAVFAAGLGGQGAQWLDTTQPQGGGAGAPGAASNPWIDQIRQQLLQRLQRDQAPVNESDNYIADPLNAARLESSRGLDQERKQNAEAAFADSQGGPIDRNALTMQDQQAAERQATGLSSLRASLISREYQARRSDLNEAMQQALASGDAQLARQIQMQMAQLDAQVRRDGYLTQKDIAEAQFNQNAVTAGRR